MSHSIKQHGRVAIAAAQRCRAGESPETAWQLEINAATSSESAQAKSCPRHAFLGLAEAGLIQGVPGRHAERQSANAQYATTAVEILRSNPALESSVMELWRSVHAGRDRIIRHNGQMDVVLALWRNGDIA